MAKDNKNNGKSKSVNVVPVDGETQGVIGGGGEDEKGKNKKKLPTVPFLSLYRYATFWDKVTIVFAILCGIAAGGTQPLLIVIFGELTDATAAITDVQALVNPAAKKLCLVAVAAMVLFGLSFSLIPLVGARITARFRTKLFEAVLRQDMSFFDRCKPGEIENLIADGVEDIHMGTGSKLAEALMAGSQFIVGFIVAFYYSWELSLVLLACMPFLGGATALMISTGVADGVFGKQAYAEAGSIATETVSSMRTVASFGGEIVMSKRYNEKLKIAEKSAIKAGIKAGAGQGTLFGIMFAMYGIGFWYGGRIINDSRTVAITDHPIDATYLASWDTYIASGGYDWCGGLNGVSFVGQAKESCLCDLAPSFWASVNMTFPNCGCQFGVLDAVNNPFGAIDLECQSVGTVLTA